MVTSTSSAEESLAVMRDSEWKVSASFASRA
jgi:hypothetical protein